MAVKKSVQSLLVSLVLFTVFQECAYSDSVPTMQHHEFIEEVELSAERNWGYLINAVSNLGTRMTGMDQGCLNYPGVSSTINDGLNRLCEQCKSGSAQCHKFRAMKDLGYAFSKMNESYFSSVKTSLYSSMQIVALPLTTVTFILARKGLKPIWKIYSPKLTEMVAIKKLGKLKAKIIPEGAVKKIQKVATKHFRKRTTRKAEQKVLYYAAELSFLSTVSKIAAIGIAAYTGTRVITDIALADRGAFYFYINRYSLGDNQAFNNWYSWIASYAYSFDNDTSWIRDAPTITARDYFDVPLDMDLYYELLRHWSHTLKPEIKSETVPFPKYPADQFNTTYSWHRELKMDQDRKNLLNRITENLKSALSRTPCQRLSLFTPKSGHFPFLYLTVCVAENRKALVYRLDELPQWHQLPVNEFSRLIARLSAATGSSTLAFYKRQ
ncbi:MAG: hypothetical protein ACR2PX_26530 [Endozoicomonas sp.]|uniref:hypothetical protein n=1 Tax=Endozoicomonas sp. TaxID=1892382 RepID=UPI003D9BC23A